MPDLPSLITAAKTGQLDALTALVETMARDLRAFIATFATSRTMLEEVHTATWIQVRKELHECPPNSQAITWVRQRAMGALRTQLEADRSAAITIRDGLRHLIAQDGLEGLEALVAPSNDGAALLNQRYAALDEATQVLVSRRYADGASLRDLAGELASDDSEVARRLFATRASLHWRATDADRRPPEDPHLVVGIEQMLSEALDPPARQQLAGSVMKDLGRAAAFARQARIDLMLHAVFGAYDREQARTLATTLAKIEHKRRNESSLLQVVAPPRTPVGSGTELRLANDRIAARQTGVPSSAAATAATRAAPRSGGRARRGGSSNDQVTGRERPVRDTNRQTLFIAGGIAVVGLVALLLLWGGGDGAAPAATGTQVGPVATVLTTAGGARVVGGATLQGGTALTAGQGIDNPRGETSVELAGAARVVLEAATVVNAFDALPDRTGQVHLSKGTVQVQVATPPGVEVRTAQARVTFGVGRGTVMSDGDRTVVHAQGGAVTVVGADGAGATQVPPDQRVEVLAGAAPRPVQRTSFVRGINLGGPSITIDRRRWLSHREALSAGFSLHAGTSIAPQTMISGAGLDFDRKTMLDTGLTGAGGPVQFSQRLPDGSYQLTLWLAGTVGIDVERMGMTVNDKPVPLSGNLLKRDSWALLGPLTVQATGGRLEVALAGQGSARVSGLTLEAPGGEHLVLPAAVAITGPVDGAVFYGNERVTLRAEVVGAVSAVQFRLGERVLGEATREPYLVTVDRLDTGEHRIVAQANNPAGEPSESLPLTISVMPAFGSGSILLERWTNLSGVHLRDGVDHPKTKDKPQHATQAKEFATQASWGDRYYARIRGYVHPPLTGDYVFWMTCDDEGELLLSTSADPADAKRIAHSPDATGARDWTKHASQQSRAIPLVAGQKYYIELRYKEHEGDDWGACGWKLPNGMLERPIPGVHLSPFVP